MEILILIYLKKYTIDIRNPNIDKNINFHKYLYNSYTHMCIYFHHISSILIISVYHYESIVKVELTA